MVANHHIYRVRLVARPGDSTDTARRQIEQLDRDIFPKDSPEPIDNRYWWVVETESGVAVGFAGLKPLSNEPHGFFCRAGILASHRKRGLHRRLIVARLRYAASLNLRSVITYTVHDNSASINALIARGFQSYTPQEKWAGAGVCYWWKKLGTDHAKKRRR
jgi:RimJ/RimL family protein N-acetyltransferase